MRTPKYSLHKPSGQARIIVNGKHQYLGRFNSPESIERYNVIVAEFVAGQANRSTMTVGRLAILFLKHAETYYRRADGTPTREAVNFRYALRHVTRECPDLPLRHFGPRKLVEVRTKMIKDGLSRKTINARVRRIRQVVKWAVSQEFCTPAILQSLTAVEAIKEGRTDAHETEPIGPVAAERIQAVRPFVSRPVWAAIQFMLLTGARPGETVAAKWSEIDTTSSIWIYAPSQHKSRHRGKGRRIVVGPQCQKVLNGIRDLTRSDYVFDPQTAVDEFARRAYGDQAKTRSVGSHYSNFSLGSAIRSACEKAFGCPRELTIRMTNKPMAGESPNAFQERRRRAAEWRRLNCWHPNQLRHTKACQVREQADLETAQIILGHSSKTTTERYYAELDISRAIDQAARFG